MILPAAIILLSTLLVHQAFSFSIQTRRCTLYSNDKEHVLGTILERKTSDSHETWIGTSLIDDNTLKVTLPFVETADSVGSSLWASSLAGSILLHCCAPQITCNKNILELGSGLGLGGFVAGRNAAHVTMTDNEEELVKLLQEQIVLDGSEDQMSANYLDWRDSFPTEQEEDQFEVCLGLDVAYYFHLIAPIVNTVRQKLAKEKSLLLVVGQANRESQWHLYHHIRDGGYNQITDEREEPWEGETKMLLYKLEVGVWTTEGEETSKIDAVLPIAALLHTTEDLQDADSLTAYDHVATQEDEDVQTMTF